MSKEAPPAPAPAPAQVAVFAVPGGIGDISWVYSKVRHLKAMLGLDVVLHAPREDPERASHFIELLPDVRWGGYLDDRTSWQVLSQSLPADWPASMGYGPLQHRGYPVNLAANLHLECGRPLASWLPLLPTDYHYGLRIAEPDHRRAAECLKGLPPPVLAAYVSSRDKDAQVAGGWRLWPEGVWTDFLASLQRRCGGSFVMLGAEYDRERTEAVASGLESRGCRVRRLLGEPLGAALACLGRCHYCVSYPSGIGILANVLRTPGLMLLPWLLTGLEKTYADPFDLACQHYRAWADPRPEEALRWVLDVSVPHLLAETGGTWPER